MSACGGTRGEGTGEVGSVQESWWGMLLGDVDALCHSTLLWFSGQQEPDVPLHNPSNADPSNLPLSSEAPQVERKEFKVPERGVKSLTS